MQSETRKAIDQELAREIKQARPAGAPLLHAEAILRRSEAPGRIEARLKLIEPLERDPHGLERILGTSDLVSTNFLLRALRASAAVAKLRARLPDGSAEWAGTGFLVAPGLLVTNNHVLPAEEAAALTIAEFNFEHDLNGVELPRRVFNLMPSVLFYTDRDHDVSFVEVAPRAFDGTPLSDFGYLPLLPRTGKGIDREWVSMIQHPKGQPKQIAIRNSQIVALDDTDILGIDLERFIHYTTDSEPGSSGSPVLNDQWQVVALHHRAVPDYDVQQNRLARDRKTIWREEMGEDEKGWIANEGVRISAIHNVLAEKQYSDPKAAAVRDRLLYGLATAPRVTLPELSSQSDLGEYRDQEADSAPAFFSGTSGYDRRFLSKPIPLPKVVSADDRKNIAKLIANQNEVELKYTHFSIVFDADRRFARFTAVNIDGNSLKQNKDVEKAWRRDGRIDVTRQCDDTFYKKSVAPEEVYFERGHLVRRVDPSWGTPAESIRAVEDTFHFTNSAPHIARFNNTMWGNLEDYLLQKCDRDRKRMTVFSGPVFRKRDSTTYGRRRPGGPFKIPVEYWKVVAIQKSPNKIAAAGFMIGQGSLLAALREDRERVFTGLSPYTPQQLVDNGIQTTIETIEAETGLDFGALKAFDSVAGLESTHHQRPLRTPDDIII